MHERVRAGDRRARAWRAASIVILDALLKLRQVCCDPRLVKLEAAQAAAGSAKLERLMEMLPELLDEGRRVLVFSQFTSMLELIEPELRRGAASPIVALTRRHRRPRDAGARASRPARRRCS